MPTICVCKAFHGVAPNRGAGFLLLESCGEVRRDSFILFSFGAVRLGKKKPVKTAPHRSKLRT